MERGLGGRGKNLLFHSADEEKDSAIEKLAITQLVPGTFQPRKRFDAAAISELAASMEKQGVLQPLIVRLIPKSMPQRYEIVAGERRWRAARQAGITELPVIITEYSDREAMTVALVENLQRENLNAMEEAEALAMLRDAHGLSQEELAAQLGKSRSAIANALRLMQLSEPMREGVLNGDISAGHARALLSVPDGTLREQLYKAVIEHRLSVREAESAADSCRQKGRLPEHLQQAGLAGTAKKKHGTKPQVVKDLQKLLRERSGKKATISGDGVRGQVSMPYASEEELETLIELLGAQKISDPFHDPG